MNVGPRLTKPLLSKFGAFFLRHAVVAVVVVTVLRTQKVKMLKINAVMLAGSLPVCPSSRSQRR